MSHHLNIIQWNRRHYIPSKGSSSKSKYLNRNFLQDPSIRLHQHWICTIRHFLLVLERILHVHFISWRSDSADITDCFGDIIDAPKHIDNSRGQIPRVRLGYIESTVGFGSWVSGSSILDEDEKRDERDENDFRRRFEMESGGRTELEGH